MMTVCRCGPTSPRSRLSTSRPVAESSIPVGSSAKTTLGLVTSARAIGMLDSATGREVLSLLRGLVGPQRQTVIMVTHDPVAAAYADRVVFLADGRVAGELRDPTAQSVAARMTGLEFAGDRS